MTSLDAGVKYKGLSLEAEYYRRWLSKFTGVNTGGIPNISDNGYQLQIVGDGRIPRASSSISAARRSSAATMATPGKCASARTGSR